MVDANILFIGILFLGGYRVYKTFNEKTKISEFQKLESISRDKAQDNKIEERKPEPAYQLHTHKVKYWLYNSSYSLRTYSLIGLYNDLVLKNLWLNEPYHTKFYEILMVLDKNELMILDPHSRVITMNVRGKDNKVSTSKSFQVFATKDIIEATLSNAMSDIVRFNHHDAQHIVIAICVIALEQSLHYQSHEVALDIVKMVLKNYAYSEDVCSIIGLLKEEDEQLKFVSSAFKIALQTSSTYAYNDSEVPKSLQLPTKLPQKFLKEI